jgi:hypothetical protein
MITIDNNTLVQIIIRTGTDASRQQIVLAAGELGYTVDTQRLFIGDGVTYGGICLTNKFLSTAASINSLSSIAIPGDTTYDPYLSGLYVFTLSGFQLI